jgi:hypothetical protein
MCDSVTTEVVEITKLSSNSLPVNPLAYTVQYLAACRPYLVCCIMQRNNNRWHGVLYKEAGIAQSVW